MRARKDGMLSRVNATEATSLANQGRAVVACSYGHIAIVIPGGSASNVRIAQAGLCNGVQFMNHGVDAFRNTTNQDANRLLVNRRIKHCCPH